MCLVDKPCDPREAGAKKGQCWRCGKTVPVPEPRDVGIERQFMQDVAELVGQMRGMSFNPAAMDAYTRKVTERLAIGSERYGDTEFLNRDNLKEVAEETPDVASYGLLEVERLTREGTHDETLQEVRSALVTAAAYAAIADEYVRHARVALVGR